MKSSHKYWSPLIGCIMLVIGLWAGWWFGHRPSSATGIGKLQTILELIQDEYVEEIDVDSLVERTLPVMLHNLDPHSVYITAEDFDITNSELESSICGIGIQFQMLNDSVYVSDVVAGGPSERAGILTGDRIVKADDQPLSGKKLSIDDVAKRLRGERGSKVNVTVVRSTAKKPLTFEITRDIIPSVSIDARYMLNDTVGYVKVSKFARNTYGEFINALVNLMAQGAKNLVVDLRGNTGGYLEPAVMMVNEFLPAGEVIVQTRGRNASQDLNLTSDGTGSFQNVPLVVLIDHNTASSSEIFSGAIQDNDRGMVIGRRSFGKGLVQHPFVLADSSEVRLTVQRYYTPSGRCIQKNYVPGHIDDYENEVYERFDRGEVFTADSIRFDADDHYTTLRGRTVYGGGGIIPDVFVPGDTTGVTPYYINLVNNNLLVRYAYEYADLNRSSLQDKSLKELLKALPSNGVLLNSFLNYASTHGVPTRPYYVNISRNLIVSQLKALIVRDILGTSAYYEVINADDPVVREALRQISEGNVEEIMYFNDPA